MHAKIITCQVFTLKTACQVLTRQKYNFTQVVNLAAFVSLAFEYSSVVSVDLLCFVY